MSEAFPAIERALTMLHYELDHGDGPYDSCSRGSCLEGRAELAAARRLVEAARSWHEFHCGAEGISCDSVCEAMQAWNSAIGFTFSSSVLFTDAAESKP
jgi:hypothetical protein